MFTFIKKTLKSIGAVGLYFLLTFPAMGHQDTPPLESGAIIYDSTFCEGDKAIPTFIAAAQILADYGMEKLWQYRLETIANADHCVTASQMVGVPFDNCVYLGHVDGRARVVHYCIYKLKSNKVASATVPVYYGLITKNERQGENV